MRSKIILSFMLTAALLTAGAATTFAAETENTSASYGYLTGQEKNSARHAQFERLPELTSDEEREAWFEEQGIGGGQYSGSGHMDVESLFKAGVIDQETAEKIQAYASAKQDQLHNQYGSDRSSMSPDERHAFYAGKENDKTPGDTVEELLEEGVITQEQAEAIRNYTG